MEIKIKNYIPAFQEGGEMAAPVEEAPMAPEEQGGDPMQQLLMACQQALETQDCNLAMQVCDALMQMAGGQQAPPQEAPEGAQPVYKTGGRLAYWAKK